LGGRGKYSGFLGRNFKEISDRDFNFLDFLLQTLLHQIPFFLPVIHLEQIFHLHSPLSLLWFFIFIEVKIVSISANRKLHLCCVGNFFYKRLKRKKPSAIIRMAMVFLLLTGATYKKEGGDCRNFDSLFLFAFCTLMSKSEEI
jgi:hypothetical protein